MTRSDFLPALAAVVLLSVPVTVDAQNWTDQQREVIDAVRTCLQHEVDGDLEATLACTHEDFLGWRYDLPSLRDKLFADDEIRQIFESGQRLVSFSVQPLNVTVHGDIAVIHYYGYYSNRDAAGEIAQARSRWTDVMTRDGDRWVWLSDHGGDDPGSPPPGA